MTTTGGLVVPLLLALLAAKGSVQVQGQAMPPIVDDCPLDMDEILPVLNYTGPLPCELGVVDGNGIVDSGLPSCEDLRGKVALVTGGSTGIGRGAAERLAAAGMKVVGTSRTPEKYPAPGTFELWQLDQTSQESVDKLIKRVKDTYGRIDFLFLNAGRWFMGDMVNSDLAAMELVMNTNFWGTLRMLRTALPLLPKQGYSRILVTNSVEAFAPAGFDLPYPASKASLSVLAQDWVVERWPNDTSPPTFTSLYPALVRTNIVQNGVLGCPEILPAQQNLTLFKTMPAMIPAEAGEAVYRIAVSPNPAKRYMISHPGSLALFQDIICRFWTQPMDKWFDPGSAPGTFTAVSKTVLQAFTCPPRQ